MKLRILPALAVLFVLAASCTSGTEGIFASIEREQKITALGGLNKNATVTSMAEYGGKYYATGGRALFSRATTATTWDSSAINGKDVAAVGAIQSVSAVFAVSAGKFWTSTDGANWTDITPTGVTAYSLVPIIDSDGYSSVGLVLLTTANGDFATIYHVTAATTPTESANLATAASLGSLSHEVTGAAKVLPNKYYLVNANYLWYVSSDAWTTGVTTLVPPNTVSPAGNTFTGLLVQGTTGYLTSKEGNLYSFTTGAGAAPAFTTLSSGVKVDSGHQTWLQSMVWNTTNSSVWIATGAAESATGKEGNGYLEWTGSALLTTPNTDTNNYSSSLLPTYALGTFFRAPTSQQYFLGTVAHGLWLWDSSAKTWSQQ